MQSSNKKTVNKIKEKQLPTTEEIQKFELNIRKKKANIEKKYVKSVVNQLYIFPRMQEFNIQTQSSSSEEDIEQTYNLKSQNVKSRKNQTKALDSFVIFEKPRARQYQSVQSDASLHSAEQGGKTLKNKTRKSKNIQISFNTKKKTPSQTKTSSQRKLFMDQYSLDNRVYATTKDPSRLVVSFRGNKKHEINISLSGRRMKTQFN